MVGSYKHGNEPPVSTKDKIISGNSASTRFSKNAFLCEVWLLVSPGYVIAKENEFRFRV
jgi:hypothetical protein